MSEIRAFGDRLDETFSTFGRLCVGIDPHRELLEHWDLPDSGTGLREFGLRVVDAVSGRAGIVKPQVAFFERHGSAGYAALERVLVEARNNGLLVIADVKRGDIGTSVSAYAESWLSPGSPLEADAMTVSPYQGFASLEDVFRSAQVWAKGVFVLAATSNPEAVVLQSATLRTSSRAGHTVAGAVVSGAIAWNQIAVEEIATGPSSTGVSGERAKYGGVGVVLGATQDLAEVGIDLARDVEGPILPVLAPGFGHQGAEIKDARNLFGAYVPGLIISESRSILSAGPNGLADEVSRHAEKASNV